MSKCTLVIYHRADFDGIFCYQIAKKKFGDLADYIGWDYADPIPEVDPNYLEIYILDLSVDGLMDDPRVIWIDHHKSAIDKYSPEIKGYRIDGVAACRLTWQYFFSEEVDIWGTEIYPKEYYVDRKVTEPIAVRLAGEFDIWDKRDPDADTFQHGLRSEELTEESWRFLLSPTNAEVLRLIRQGKAVEYARNQSNASMIKEAGFTVDFEGFRFLAFNTTRCNSLTFTAGLTEEHQGCLAFGWVNGQWKVSLYGVPGKPDLDFSVIAVKYGGGGHKQACGFRVSTLPFMQNV